MRAYWWSVCLLLTAAALSAPAQAPDGSVQPAGLFGGRGAPPCAAPCQNCPPGVVMIPGATGTPGASLPGTTGTPGTGAAAQPGSSLDPLAGNAAFAGAGEGGGTATGGEAQFTLGDLIGLTGRQFVGVATSNGQFFSTRRAVLPIVGKYQGIKIADYESPVPLDRVYFTYNHYSRVNASQLPAGASEISTQRELIGLEKTFLSGNASFGFRLPFSQVYGANFDETNVIDDLSLTFKYALVNNKETGTVLSGGMVLTLPTGERTGPAPVTVQQTAAFTTVDPITGAVVVVPATFSTIFAPDANTRSVLFQPWAGGSLRWDRLYATSFSSIVIPTDSRDPIVAFTSLSVGYFLYRADPCQTSCEQSMLRSIVPVLEAHLNTPLNHRNDTSDVIVFQDQLNLTGGCFVNTHRFTIGGGVCVPVVGPKPYSIEALGNITWRF